MNEQDHPMIPIPSAQPHPASVDAYIRHGWSLVPIPPGTKGPRIPNWNQRANALRSQAELPPGYGIGLAHAYSGTMALDIDDWDLTANLLREHGIDLDALYHAPDAVVIDSGRQGHGKLLYSMPFTLPSKKVSAEGRTAYELRCATANGLTVQDVLPPSIHPDTQQPYRWAGDGHWTRLPAIPMPLLDLWNSTLMSAPAPAVEMPNLEVVNWDEVESAVQSITPDCTRDEWIAVGMALHRAGVLANDAEHALDLWDKWSARGRKYPGQREILRQWASFRSERSITLGTLYHVARQYGWIKPAPDASVLFRPVSIEPQALLDTLRPPPPDVNLDLFPAVLATRAGEVAMSMGVDVLVPLWAGLGAVAGVVDARIRLELAPGFRVPPILWIMTIGEPADKKTPGSAPMLDCLPSIELDDRVDYAKALLEWEGKEAAHAASKKAFLDWHARPEALLDGGEGAPAVQDLPEPPVPLKITMSDITSQAMVRKVAQRPRGMLGYFDEMHSWIKKMTDKASGEDRSSWVAAYEGRRYEMDRVGAGAIHAENLAVSIFGNVQPRVLAHYIEQLSQDGLLQRFIPITLRPGQTRLGTPMPEYMTTSAAWEHLLRTVFSLPPQTYRLSPEAYHVFREFQVWYEQRKLDERLLCAGDVFMTAFGKLEGLTGRLALIWHLIERPFDVEVSADVMERVVLLVRSYVVQSFRYALGEVGGTSPFDRWLTDHIIQHCTRPQITLSEIRRSARRQIEHVPQHVGTQWILGGMQMLEQIEYVARIDDRLKEHQGIATWAINPALAVKFAAHRAARQDARDRQLADMYRLSPNPPPTVRRD